MLREPASPAGESEGAYLFEGSAGTRVRRRLPNTRDLADCQMLDLPVRILLVSARPEDKTCSYIYHRNCAKSLVNAMRRLAGRVHLTFLDPPTFPNLMEKPERAKTDNKQFHVLHFDGHREFCKERGLGGLCFEDPQCIDNFARRGHQTIFADTLASESRNYRIPLVFLDACRIAQAENASGSLASELLKAGVESVVAMSDVVLVDAARRFAEKFYLSLAEGNRVGDAMLAGQRELVQR